MFTIKQYVFMYGSLLGSMLGGASFMHYILRPDTRLPQLKSSAPRPHDVSR